MAQYDLNLSDYERIFRKRYKLVIFITIIVTAFSILFSRMKPSIYKTVSSVKVDRSSAVGLEMSGYMPWDYWDNIETQAKVVTSFPVIKRAAILMGIVDKKYLDQKTVSDPTVLAKINSLSGKVKSSLETGTNIIEIKVVSGDPEEARDLANAVAQAYKEITLEEKKAQITKTRMFVNEQLLKSKDELAVSEKALQEFEEKQKIPSVDQDLLRTIEKLSAAEGEIEEMKQRQEIIKSQRQKLVDMYNAKSGNQTSDFKPAASMEISGKTEKEIEWVSELTTEDPGLQSLNDRLINLQLNLEDMLSYRKKDHPQILSLEKKIQKTLKQIIAHYDSKLRNLYERQASISAKLSDFNEDLEKLPGNHLRYMRLVRNLRVNEELYTILTKKLQEARISEAGMTDDVTVMSVASLPIKPINKNISRIGIIGLFLGFLLGVLLAIFREMMDTSIGTIEDVEHFINIPVLATIPHIMVEEQEQKLLKKWPQAKASHSEARARLITQFDPKNPAAEAYRILRTNIQFLSADNPAKIILLTSTTMQEGKSTTIANLATAFAQEGKRVLLIGNNLRRPSLYRMFGLPKGPGLADILIDKVHWKDCVRNVSDLTFGEFNVDDILQIPGLENLHIITFGQVPPNPSELIASKRMDKFLSEVRDAFDIVLIDAPPLLPVADSSLLATKVDGVIIVYQVGKVPRNSLVRSRERLQNVKARILGLVLNDIRPEVSGASYVSQYYMHYYGDKPDQPKKKKVKFNKGVKSVATGAWFSATTAACSDFSSSLFMKCVEIAKSGPFKGFLGVLAFFLTVGSISLKLAGDDGRITDASLPDKKNQTEVNEKRDPQKTVAAPVSEKEIEQVSKVIPEKEIKKQIKPLVLDTFYTFQISSWEAPENAEAACSKLIKKDIPAWIDSLQTRQGGVVYRICAGRFSRLKEIRSYLKTHSEKEYKKALCIRISAPEKRVWKTVEEEKPPVVTKENTVRKAVVDTEKKEMKETDHLIKKPVYSLQIYSFKESVQAEAATDMLEKMGVNTRVVKVHIRNRGVYYRVCSGMFDTREQAKQYKKSLKHTQFKNSYIIRCLPAVL